MDPVCGVVRPSELTKIGGLGGANRDFPHGLTLPEDVKGATGHRIRAKRSKSGAVSFDLLVTEENRAAF